MFANNIFKLFDLNKIYKFYGKEMRRLNVYLTLLIDWLQNEDQNLKLTRLQLLCRIS